MRFWLLVLMMALLPLRGWVGDAMAGQMLAHKLGATVASTAAATVTADVQVQHADCAGHAQDAQDKAESIAVDAGDCGTCTACQICHFTAFVGASDVAMWPFTFSAAPALASVAFSSADALAGFKPPKN